MAGWRLRVGPDAHENVQSRRWEQLAATLSPALDLNLERGKTQLDDHDASPPVPGPPDPAPRPRATYSVPTRQLHLVHRRGQESYEILPSAPMPNASKGSIKFCTLHNLSVIGIADCIER